MVLFRLLRPRTEFQAYVNDLTVYGAMFLEVPMSEVSASELLSECDALVLQCNAVAETLMAGGFNPLALLALVRKVRDLVAALAALAGNPDVVALLASAKAIIDEIKALFSGDTPEPQPTPPPVV